MTNARSNFLRRKKVLAQERKKRCNDILTSAWIHEQTKDEGIEWLRCSRCHYTYSLTTNQLDRYEYPCMCPLCNCYMLGVDVDRSGVVLGLDLAAKEFKEDKHDQV